MRNDNLVLTIVIIILALFAISTLFNTFSYNRYGYGMMSMMGNYWGGYGTMPVFGWLFMIVILIALILFIVWLVRQLQHPQEVRRRRR